MAMTLAERIQEATEHGTDQDGYTLLHLFTISSLFNPDAEAKILALIANGADVNAIDKYGDTPLDLTDRYTHHPDNFGNFEAMDKVKEILYQAGGKVVSGRTYLQWVAKVYSAEKLQALLDTSVDLLAVLKARDGDKQTILHYANSDNVPLLVKAGAELEARDYYGYTPLLRAIDYNDRDKVQQLLIAGADMRAPTRFGLPAVFFASRSSNPQMVQMLIEAGANINETTVNGNTLLHIASVENLPFLMNQGLNLEARNISGETPLLQQTIRASERYHGIDHDKVISEVIQKVEYLLTVGANVNVQDKDGYSPLFYAISAESSVLVSLLLRKGANPREACISGNGSWPLQMVFDTCDIEITRLMLKAWVPQNDAEAEALQQSIQSKINDLNNRYRNCTYCDQEYCVFLQEALLAISKSCEIAKESHLQKLCWQAVSRYALLAKPVATSSEDANRNNVVSNLMADADSSTNPDTKDETFDVIPPILDGPQ